MSLYESLYPPVCVYGPHSKQWYVIANGVWHAVDRMYSWKELESVWKRLEPQPKKQDKPIQKLKEFTVEGSKGNKYRITQLGEHWTCSCPAHGFGRGKDCKHITQIKKTQ